MKHFTPDLLQKRLNELKALNGKNAVLTVSVATEQKKVISNQNINEKTSKKIKEAVKQQDDKEFNILSKNDIIRGVTKIKPYLQDYGQVEAQEEFGPEEADLLSEMLIRQNSRICSKLNVLQPLEKASTVTSKRKPGCVFEVFFYEQEVKNVKSDEPQINTKKMENAYAVVTQILQIYLALADHDPVCSVQMKAIQFVKYHNDLEYDYTKIRRLNPETGRSSWVNIGFISKKQFNLFDRMLFLAKQVSRTSPGRLFDNKLLFEILDNY